MRTDPPADYSSEITADQIGWWADILSSQGILREEIEPDEVLLD